MIMVKNSHGGLRNHRIFIKFDWVDESPPNLTFLKIYVIINYKNERGIIMFITILKLLGICIIAAILMCGLIYSLATLIWGAMTWEDDD